MMMVENKKGEAMGAVSSSNAFVQLSGFNVSCGRELKSQGSTHGTRVRLYTQLSPKIAYFQYGEIIEYTKAETNSMDKAQKLFFLQKKMITFLELSSQGFSYGNCTKRATVHILYLCNMYVTVSMNFGLVCILTSFQIYYK